MTVLVGVVEIFYGIHLAGRDEKGQLECDFYPCAKSKIENAILFSLLFPHEVSLQMQKQNMLNVAKGN